MKTSVKFFAMAATLCAFTIACNKENPVEPEPEYPEEPVQPVIASSCEHGNLEFVAAVQRTDTTGGNIAHYHCPDCNRCFLDAEATTEIHHAYLPAKNYCIDSTILNRIQHIYPFVPTPEPVESAIKGKQKRTALIPQAISKLYTTVSNYKTGVKNKAIVQEMLTSLNEIQASVNQIDEKVTVVQKQVSQILTMLEDTPYVAQTRLLCNRAAFIYQRSEKYIPYLLLEYQDYLNDKTTLAQFEEALYEIGGQWQDETSADFSDIYGITTQLIEEFSSKIVKGENLSYPQLFKKYIACYRVWDNEGYTDRKQLDLVLESSLSVGYFMCCLYRDHTKDYKYSRLRRDDSTALATNFGNIEPLVQSDLDKMNNAYNAYRHFNYNGTSIYINNTVWNPNPDCIKDNNRLSTYNIALRYNDQDKFAAGIDEMLKCWDDVYGHSIRSGNVLSVADYTTIRNAYTNGDIYSILANNAKIAYMPSYCGQTRKLGGANRPLFIPATNMSKWDKHDDIQNWGTRLATCYCYYNQYYTYYYCDATNCNYAHTLYLSEASINKYCEASDYYDIIYGYYHDGHKDSNSAFRILNTTSYYKAKSAPVYIGKYTGTIYDN